MEDRDESHLLHQLQKVEEDEDVEEEVEKGEGLLKVKKEREVEEE